MDGNELKQVLDAFAELRGEMTGLRGEMTGLRGEMGELRAHVDATAIETRRHFEVALEGLNLTPKFELIAEIVRAVDEKLDREANGIRTEMRQGFADTQAMLLYSNNQLGRRVTALENAGDR